MPDVYAAITEADAAVLERLAEVLELRAADPQQCAMREAYLSDIEFPESSRVLEVGCGPGPVTRVLARWSGAAEAVGVDPSPVFIAKARERSAGIANVSYHVGDGRSLTFSDCAFDVVVFHTTLCHIPDPAKALAEAFRVLRPAGWLAVFDGDYASTTVAIGKDDPLQTCAEAWVGSFVHDRWLMRRLPRLARTAGFQIVRLRSHGYVETSEPHYMLTIVDRGADALAGSGRIGADTAAALKAEARRRVDEGGFCGHIAYVSIVARRPGWGS